MYFKLSAKDFMESMDFLIKKPGVLKLLLLAAAQAFRHWNGCCGLSFPCTDGSWTFRKLLWGCRKHYGNCRGGWQYYGKLSCREA